MSENSITLFQLNQLVKEKINQSFPTTYWIKAEISEFRENATGHCYLELVEKDVQNDRIIAKMKANIWSYTYKMLKPYFETATGQMLTAGIKILVSVNVEFHELYGISLVIKDIDPTYTLGDMARRRMQIINRLREEGVMDMNKELEMPIVPQRIAVISSPTAAGYGDFMDQLNHNSGAYHFYCKLFPAVMQGDQTESSIIAALDKIYQYYENFDVVVIIRGGGATADLSAFDNYELAYYCTQFPLPILTGIGHQRDETILDLVAHRSLKTPTAVAENIIEMLEDFDAYLDMSQSTILDYAEKLIQYQQQQLEYFSKEISQSAKRILQQEKNELNMFTHQIKSAFLQIVSDEKREIKSASKSLKQLTNSFLKIKRQQTFLYETNLKLISPQYILERGYSLTTKRGKVVLNAAELIAGDEINTRFANGSANSTIK
jgi:exodeoxyribonuclease VII large subunit